MPRIKGSGMKSPVAFSLTVPSDTATKLRASAASDGRSAASLIRHLVEQHLKSREQNRT